MIVFIAAAAAATMLMMLMHTPFLLFLVLVTRGIFRGKWSVESVGWMSEVVRGGVKVIGRV